MKKFVTSAALTIVILALLIMPVSAQNCKGEMQGMNMGMMNSEKGLGPMMNVPDLTDEQMNQIEKLQLANHRKMIDLEYKHSLKLVDLHEAMQINADEKKALSIVEELGKIETEIQKTKITNHFSMRKLLTKDQLKFFDMKKHHMGMNEGKGMKNGNFNSKESGKEDCGNCSK